MKFMLSLLLIAVLSLIATWYLPWWSLAVVAFLVCCFVQQSSGRSFLVAFLAVFLLWLCFGLWKDNGNAHLLATRMAGVFGLPHYSLYLVVAALIGGLAAGFAGWAGSLTRKAFQAPKAYKSPHKP